MTLQDKLDEYKAGFKRNVPQDKQDIMAKATADLEASGQADRTVKVGQKLPPFTLKNQDGGPVSSDALLATGPLVISFFRGVWCPYCNIELGALNDAHEDFVAAGAQLVTIAPQLAASAQETRKKHDLKFDVLIDEGNRYADELGIAFPLPKDLRDVYLGFGLDIPAHNGDDSWRLPMATRIVVAQDGTIADIDVNADYTVRPDPSQTIEEVRKLTRQAA